MFANFDHGQTEQFYEEYYQRQVGDGLSVYSGRTVMDGDGIGSFLGGMLKKMTPALKSVAKTVGRNALGIVRDVVDGKDLKQSAMRGLRSAGGEVLGDVFDAVSVDNSNAPTRPSRKRASRRGGGSRKKKRGTVFD